MKTIALRSLQAAFIASAMTFLTGANGQGCGKVMIEEPPTQASPAPTPVAPPAAQCAAGWHIDQVCSTPVEAAVGCAQAIGGAGAGAPSNETGCIGVDDPPSSPAECHDECVPDGPCEPGFVQQETCAVAAQPMPDCPPNADCAAPPEPMPSCALTCVPAACPQGSHAEWSCAGGSAPSEPGQADGGSAAKPVRCMPNPDPQPMPDGPCSMTCVADSMCPPGSMEQTTCSTCARGSEGQGDCVADCYTECVPFGAPEPVGDAPQPGAAR